MTTMSTKIIYNSKVMDSLDAILFDNRAFRYGDGLFETIRVIKGKSHNLMAHYNRLLSGINVLNLKGIENLSFEKLNTDIRHLIEANGLLDAAKVRLHVFRSGGGTYLSNNDYFDYVLTAESLDNSFFKVNSEGLKVDIYPDLKKPKNILSNLKTANGMLYVMAMNFAKKNNLDECFILNLEGQIIEAAKSNIILVSNGVLYTPPLSDGCIGGTMRMNVINTALENKIKVYESSITPQNLLIADEIILTNAIQGLQWVGEYKTKTYSNQITRNLIGYINEKIFSEFEVNSN
jgi:branched-subunit amino acid aminotransferase/4-amino-4-deoxychorismate lyase